MRNYNLILARADSIEKVQSIVDQLTTIHGERTRVIALQSLTKAI
ncbi:hypothetical protein HRbin02_01810 [Candidatus Calditenuaceae archaeon HR02]|nr:hypothetical protein HRbin02_01810 [Candidatus Calditenuaceae archaeon HR02]